MQQYQLKVYTEKMLSDTFTPVGIYMRLRDVFANTIMLESSDYHSSDDSFSFICLEPLAEFLVGQGSISEKLPKTETLETPIENRNDVTDGLRRFMSRFSVKEGEQTHSFNGFYGYTSYDAVQYFETLDLNADKPDGYEVPVMRYAMYRYIIAVNHFRNEMVLIENVLNGGDSNLQYLKSLLTNKSLPNYSFTLKGTEQSDATDAEFIEMVEKGKQHCHRGDVIQMVLSRRFEQKFRGDEFKVYRALRSVNPSPYLFYFDYGTYRIFGSSPEAQLSVKGSKATINPIAGTFKRTGKDAEDKALAVQLRNDPKENAEHVMLVDLARNDLSRNTTNVKVETYREVQFFSHVIHLVSQVSGKLKENTDLIKLYGDTFPAGTLSGAPKFRAMELIDSYEKTKRGFYGGAIGFLGFDQSLNHAITIRSFLSKNNTLVSRAGAGVVYHSQPESELAEVKNKLAALKSALKLAEEI